MSAAPSPRPGWAPPGAAVPEVGHVRQQLVLLRRKIRVRQPFGGERPCGLTALPPAPASPSRPCSRSSSAPPTSSLARAGPPVRVAEGPASGRGRGSVAPERLRPRRVASVDVAPAALSPLAAEPVEAPEECSPVTRRSPPSGGARPPRPSAPGHAPEPSATAKAPLEPSATTKAPRTSDIGGVALTGALFARIAAFLPVAMLPSFRRLGLLAHTVVAKSLHRDGALRASLDAHIETRRLGSKRVWVVVRARPSAGAGNCLAIDGGRVAVAPSGPSQGFSFFCDRAFDGSSTQEEVCSYIGERVMPHALNGEHVCLMAYGQTGSGKTHTMFGSLDGGEHRGLAFRAVDTLAALLQGASTGVRLSVDFSFLEVYNDELYDLLDGSKRLPKQRSAEKHVVPVGLTRRRCDAAQMQPQVHAWLREGAATRTVGKTVFNPRSSRSHGVVLLHLCWGPRDGDTRSASRLLSTKAPSGGTETRIYLVDLAGSERAGLYAMDPEQLKEGEAINLSLSALGRVVGALATGKCKHVPYRDSALTWLLKDAVTGTSARVCMVAAVHPNHAQESASTLRYAHQYSALQTSSGSRVSDLTSEVRQQQRRVDGLKRAFESACAGTEHGIAWTPEALSGTVRPSRAARDLVEAHPFLAWTPLHQSKWAVRGQRRDQSGIGRVSRVVDAPEARGASEAADGRLLPEAWAAAQGGEGMDRCAEVVFEGRHGRPPVVLWYPEQALEEVRPPQSLLDAKAAYERGVEELAQKRAELKAAREFVCKERKELMAKDG